MIARLPDYYALLGVEPRADRQAIRAAYRALAKQYHPDSAAPDAAQSAEQFVEVQEAYDVLGDPDRRAQYDLECARRRDAQEELLRQQRAAFVLRRAPGMTPMQPLSVPAPRRKKSSSLGWISAGLLAFVVIMVAGFLVQQHLERITAESERGTIVRVDPSRGGRHGGRDAVAANISELSRDVEQLSRLQANQAETAKSRLAAHAEGDQKANSMMAALPPPALPQQPRDAGSVSCTGEGRKFSVVRQSDTISVSYNGGPPMHPTVDEQGAAGMIVMSKVEPTGRISIGFIRGDKDRTILIVSDSIGNIYRTIGVDCSGAVF
jgi:curved DNA-binding protein CbpA